MVPFGRRGGTGGIDGGKVGIGKGKEVAGGWGHPAVMTEGGLGVGYGAVLLRVEKD